MITINSGFSLMEQNVGGKGIQFYRKPHGSGTRKNELNENRYFETPPVADVGDKL